MILYVMVMVLTELSSCGCRFSAMKTPKRYEKPFNGTHSGVMNGHCPCHPVLCFSYVVLLDNIAYNPCKDVASRGESQKPYASIAD